MSKLYSEIDLKLFQLDALRYMSRHPTGTNKSHWSGLSPQPFDNVGGTVVFIYNFWILEPRRQ